MTDKPTPTDTELKAMWQLHAADIGGIFHYARAVLAKWGQPAQAAEPVAWLDDGAAFAGSPRVLTNKAKECMPKRLAQAYSIPLFTAPQPVAREPLTPEQIGQDPIFRAGVRFAEQHHGIKGGQHDD